ncbi:hypothetical protein ACJJTC_010914 [Scirpophaga incertulas]
MNDSEIDNLRSELEHEKSCREAAAWQNGELEKQIMSMQEELRKGEYSWVGDEDLGRESSKHKMLLEDIEDLKAKLPLLREKIKNARTASLEGIDDSNINLDLHSSKQGWRLDSESKLFVRVNDQRTYLQNELLICQNNILRLQKNGPFWQGVPRKIDERVLDPKRGPIKKVFERLPPIAAQ